MYKEKYENLVNAIIKDKNPKLLCESITLAMKSFCDYVSIVYNIEINTMITKCKGERINNVNKTRKIAHENVIGQLYVINIICEMLEVEPLFDGNINDRHEVENFCMAITKELFDKR